MGFNKPKLKEIIKKEIVEILSELTPDEATKVADETERAVAAAEKLKKALGEQEEEPTASDLKSDSVSSLARELGKITREMKTVVNQWKKSEGEEKEDLLNRLKELTSMKKEVEALL
jgi:HSP90 family molecular chaperone